MISLLDSLDTDVSDAQNRLTQAREKMQKLLKTNSILIDLIDLTCR